MESWALELVVARAPSSWPAQFQTQFKAKFISQVMHISSQARRMHMRRRQPARGACRWNLRSAAWGCACVRWPTAPANANMLWHVFFGIGVQSRGDGGEVRCQAGCEARHVMQVRCASSFVVLGTRVACRLVLSACMSFGVSVACVCVLVVIICARQPARSSVLGAAVLLPVVERRLLLWPTLFRKARWSARSAFAVVFVVWLLIWAIVGSHCGGVACCLPAPGEADLNAHGQPLGEAHLVSAWRPAGRLRSSQGYILSRELGLCDFIYTSRLGMAVSLLATLNGGFALCSLMGVCGYCCPMCPILYGCYEAFYG